MRTLGIDPGLRATGFGVVDLGGSRRVRVAGGVIRPGGDCLASRLAEIMERLEAVISETRPDHAALEAVFVSRNPRSALLLGHARGAALTACGRAGIPTAECAPAAVKVAVTGYGRASKDQVQRMVQRLLGLGKPPASDEADALAVAICHGHSLPARGRASDSASARRGRRGRGETREVRG